MENALRLVWEIFGFAIFDCAINLGGVSASLQIQTQADVALPDRLADLAGNSTWEAIGPQLVLTALAGARVAWSCLRKKPGAG